MTRAGHPHRAGAATYRDALHNSEFRGLVVAQVASEWGDNIARVALASLVLARTDSAFLAVLAFVVSFVPAVFGSALLGTAADRLPRKVVLIGCDLARAVVITILALVAVDGTEVWVLLALLLVAETFTAPFEAAYRAVVPDVLPDPRVTLAGTGLMRVLYQVDQVVGIVAAGVVIVLVGERAGLLIDVGTFAVSGLVLAATLRWRPAVREPGGHTTLLTDVRAGWRLVFDDPSMRALVLLGWSAAVFLVAPEAVALAYARDDGADPAVGAALMASLPAGAAIGAWLVSRLDPLRQVRSIVPLAVVACLPLMATSLAPPWEVALGLWFLSGTAQGFMVPLLTTVNLVTPQDMRGRVNGLAGGGFALVTASTYLLAGAGADLASPAVAVTFAAVVGLTLVGVAHRTWPHGELRRTAERVYRAERRA
ncbi:MAG: MFS transporter [Sporichthyaceae bacterium]